jgi:hypothetical protein
MIKKGDHMSEQRNSIHPNPNPKNEGSIFAGVLIGLLIYIGAFFIGTIVGLGPFLLFGGPVVHLIAIIIFFSIGRKFTGIGLLILAGVVILLASACFGIVMYGVNGN